jgi:hypothetical protein
VRIGALIIVVTLVLDTFAQQLVQFDQVAVELPASLAAAQIPRADRYSKGNTFGGLSRFAGKYSYVCCKLHTI